MMLRTLHEISNGVIGLFGSVYESTGLPRCVGNCRKTLDCRPCHALSHTDASSKSKGRNLSLSYSRATDLASTQGPAHTAYSACRNSKLVKCERLRTVIESDLRALILVGIHIPDQIDTCEHDDRAFHCFNFSFLTCHQKARFHDVSHRPDAYQRRSFQRGWMSTLTKTLGPKCDHKQN